jgi:hypothetical protein
MASLVNYSSESESESECSAHVNEFGKRPRYAFCIVITCLLCLHCITHMSIRTETLPALPSLFKQARPGKNTSLSLFSQI